MKTLYWFTRDLRLHDNAALLAASHSDLLLCVYVVDPRWFTDTTSHPQSPHQRMGPHRWRFLWQSLMDLERSLRAMGQRLHIAWGQPEQVLPTLAHDHGITRIIRSRLPGTEEARVWQQLRQSLPDLMLQQFETLGLFTEGSLPAPLDHLPDTFSAFRRQVEKQGERYANQLRIRTLSALPPPPGFAEDNRGECPAMAEPDHPNGFTGGEQAGLGQLQSFVFEQQGIARYKQTRNALDDWTSSSKLSPWLANGSLSAREVAATVEQYERDYLSNDSTYWLWFELLWREYFHWYAFRHGRRLFCRDGVQRKRRPVSFYPQRFRAWCEGTTEYPLVNAAMNQLRHTGYMSNRARQLVASCLVNELELDWRYGAAWFEQQLVDYDPGSNYGNWQYLAGVGADPRGLRRFNLAKQAEQYDPDGAFVRRWQGQVARPTTRHQVDAADWPLA